MPVSLIRTKVLLLMVSVMIFSCKHEANQGEKIFDITAFGAVGDSVTINTGAIQKAINACAESGGGTVLIPRGCFSSGAVFLKKDVRLRISDGAKLRAVKGLEHYPTLKNTRIAGIEMDWPSAFINVIDVSDVSISGNGTIDGSGYYWWEDYWIKRDSLSKTIAGDLIDWYVPRPRLILVQNSTDVTLEKLNLRNAAFWTVHICYSQSVHIDGLNIENPVLPEKKKAASSDGIDVDSSSDVFISNSTISVDDDCIAIKSGRGSDGLRVNRSSENVVITNCNLLSGHGGVSIGTETAGGIRNVYVRNCRSKGNEAPIKFKPRKGRGGVIENIVHEGWVIEDAGTVIDYSYREIKAEDYVDEWHKISVPFAKATPRYRNITIRNVQATNSKEAISFLAWPLAHAENIILENISIESDEGATFQYIDNLFIKNVNVTSKDNKWKVEHVDNLLTLE